MIMQKVELLRAAACVAGADQDVTEREHRLLKKLADEIGVGDASLDAMIQRAMTDKTFYDEQFKIISADPDQAMTVLVRVAMADGELAEDEKQILARLAKSLGMSGERFVQYVKAAKKKLDEKNS